MVPRALSSLLLALTLVAPASAQHDDPPRILLITSADLAPAWATFAAWKTQLGKPTEVVSTSDLPGEGPLPPRIRAFVAEAVAERNVQWVILGGDSEPRGGLVPDVDTAHRIGGRYPDVPTDLYYVTRGPWPTPGRLPSADLDLRAIAALGRIPVRTAADVEAYTAKVIAYESRYPEADFARRLLYTCAVPQADFKSDLLWDHHLAPAWPRGEILRFFTGRTPWDRARPGDYDLTPDHLVARLTSRTAGKLHIHGHGHLPAWVLEHHRTFEDHHARELHHPDAYPIITTVSCFTGQFDGAADPSITEAMLRQPEGGAIAIVAPSRPGVPVFPGLGRDPRDGRTQDGTTGLLTRFWREGLAHDRTAGDALRAAQADLLPTAHHDPGAFWLLCEINLLGDPTLDLRARDPRTPSLTVEVRDGTLRIRTDAPDATVCVQAADTYRVLATDADGALDLPWEGGAEGLRVTVSGPSLNATTWESAQGRAWY